ncbi:MAG: glycine cleavage system protein H [Vicinamibacterales bacterium]
MQTLLATLESIGIFVAGMAIRLGLLLVVLLALALLFLAGLALYRIVEAAWRRAHGVRRVDGVLYQDGVFYATGHTWVAPSGTGTVRVGLDDLAQRVLAGLTRVSLPASGALLSEGQPAVEVACGKKRASIAAPVDGRVAAVNVAAARDPSLVRRDPYHRGWLFEMEVPSSRYRSLRTGDEARSWMNREAARLTSFLEHHLAIAAADGGEIIAPGPSLLTDDQWKALTAAFLAPTETEVRS